MAPPKDSIEEKPIKQSAPRPTQSSVKGGSQPLSLRARLTPALLEEAGKNGVSIAKLAKQLGLDQKNGGKRIDAILYNPKNAELKQAWKRGKAMRDVFKGKKSAGDTEQSASESDSPNDPTDFIIPEKAKPEEKPPIQLPPFNMLPEEDLLEEELAKVADPEFTDLPLEIEDENQALELIGSPARREKIEEVQEKLMPRGFSGDVHILGRIAVTEPDGLTLKFNGDFFSLAEKQRRILCEMAALNDEFREEI